MTSKSRTHIKRWKMTAYGEHKRKATPTWRSEPVIKRLGKKRARARVRLLIEEGKEGR